MHALNLEQSVAVLGWAVPGLMLAIENNDLLKCSRHLGIWVFLWSDP